MNRRPWIAALLLLGLVISPGLGCRGGSSAAKQAGAKTTALEWWGVFDNPSDFQEIIAAYHDIHPNVRIQFRRFRFEEYDNELLRAFAEGNGPDIFMVQNTSLPQYQNLLQSMPASLKIVFLETKGGLKKETVSTFKDVPTITIRQLQKTFVDTVAEDVIRPYQETPDKPAQNRIWGLPFSVDTLALFYNKDLLNAAGFPQPPSTWKEFQTQVKALTRLDGSGNIVQSGAAIGTAKNVERAADILAALMMQNGTQVLSENGTAAFAQPIESGSRDLPAADAVRFYTDFANPLKEVYTWNEKQPDSFDAFANGQAAFFFGYSYHAPLLAARNPKLALAIAPLPQIGGGRTANVTNYWIQSVAKDTKHANEAWDFIQFAASKDQVGKYLKSAQRPTALRELISSQVEDIQLSAFASQVLTAKTWYRGRDSASAEAALGDLIKNALTAERLEDEIRIAQNKVNQTL